VENWRDEYEWVSDFSEDRARVQKDGKQGHVNFSEGQAWVWLGNKEGHINLAGEVTWNE